MWLFVDTSERDFARVALLGPRIVIRTATGRGRVLHALSAVLPARRLSAVSGVCVVAGPGPFSAVRSGVLVGNLLARVLGVPLMRILKDDASDLRRVQARLREGYLRPVAYVSPIYDAEPNITCRP
ncbi:hypothetical protein KJZ71_04065 [Patescibacteria group bacterium]|uniref:Gcp-like domain-containing protein n=1 Tax=candidate division WWE3 bacterium TaxID=2053526 RepID=A0A928Y5T6_UNCKA|nr:hypothetical protein [candidate division WWE3 bacterium]MCL4732947.1 hypothetical protein [Patescibacteria group bacterium]MDL1952858.1 hypothetical protein [Candidatus Uhrbacteria bacterium UHB]RIL01093.1 MAG: hypothetical protein DCC77_00955 [Candidatus Uhrbacteria bacterium]